MPVDDRRDVGRQFGIVTPRLPAGISQASQRSAATMQGQAVKQGPNRTAAPQICQPAPSSLQAKVAGQQLPLQALVHPGSPRLLPARSGSSVSVQRQAVEQRRHRSGAAPPVYRPTQPQRNILPAGGKQASNVIASSMQPKPILPPAPPVYAVMRQCAVRPVPTGSAASVQRQGMEQNRLLAAPPVYRPVLQRGVSFRSQASMPVVQRTNGIEQLPDQVLAMIGQYVGGTQRISGTPVAQAPQALGNLALVSRRFTGVAHDPSVGFLTARAVREQAATPNHQPERNALGNPGRFETQTTIALPPRFHVDPDSIRLYQQGGPHTAYSGVINIHTGEIFLYPLKESDINDDGYDNRPWKGTAQFHGQPVEPINHFGDRRAPARGWVSHEIFAKVILAGDENDHVGFTLWSPRKDTGRVRIVWSSRSLNKDKFFSNADTKTGGGHTNREWAMHATAAMQRDLVLIPRPNVGHRLSSGPALSCSSSSSAASSSSTKRRRVAGRTILRRDVLRETRFAPELLRVGDEYAFGGGRFRLAEIVSQRSTDEDEFLFDPV
jgi:hypothetical protein